MYVLWFAELTAIFGFSFAFPFIPIYLHHQLHVADPRELALWTGASGFSAGISQAILSPAWGALADRYGRKAMLVRAMVGGGVTVLAMGFVQTPGQLVAVRFVQGATSGTVAAATTLVAAGTPRERVGWAMGLLSSGVALGSAVGPLVGGIAATFIGLRVIFIGAGIALIASVIPVLLAVTEPPAPPAQQGRQRPLAVLRAAGAGTLAAVAVLLVAQMLCQVAWSGAQPLITLKVISLMSRSQASTITGIAFAAAGIASALAGATYSRLSQRFGYRRLAAGGSLAGAGSLAMLALAVQPAEVVIAALLAGLLFGIVIPALSAMLGLEAPAAIQGRLFGFAASAVALGFALGPLMAGTAAGFAGVGIAVWLCAGVALLLAGLMAAAAREPAR